MPIRRVWDLQVDRGGGSPAPNKMFRGTRYNKGKAGRKEGRSFGFIDRLLRVVCCSRPFHFYLIIIPHCFSEQTEAQKDKMVCLSPQSQ